MHWLSKLDRVDSADDENGMGGGGGGGWLGGACDCCWRGSADDDEETAVRGRCCISLVVLVATEDCSGTSSNSKSRLGSIRSVLAVDRDGADRMLAVDCNWYGGCSSSNVPSNMSSMSSEGS